MTKAWVEASKEVIQAVSKAIDIAIDDAECSLSEQGVALSKTHRLEVEVLSRLRSIRTQLIWKRAMKF